MQIEAITYSNLTTGKNTGNPLLLRQQTDISYAIPTDTTNTLLKMSHPPQFDEKELLVLVDRLVRTVPGINGGTARIRQITQRQERYRGGYDAVVTSVLPFYIQAKTAEFHPENSRSDIVANRTLFGVPSRPGAFSFYLRKHRNTTEPLQHNALFWLSLKWTAAYVCPTFLSEATLDRRMEEALRTSRHEVWSYQDAEYQDFSTGQISQIRARHFHGLVTIVPHRLVDHYLHRYSYDNVPNPNVLFHSEPEPVEERASLSEFIEKIISLREAGAIYKRPAKTLSVTDLKEQQLKTIEMAFDPSTEGLTIDLSDVSEALFHSGISASKQFRQIGSAFSYLKKLDWLDLSAFWGGLLKEKYNVDQYMSLEMLE